MPADFNLIPTSNSSVNAIRNLSYASNNSYGIVNGYSDYFANPNFDKHVAMTKERSDNMLKMVSDYYKQAEDPYSLIEKDQLATVLNYVYPEFSKEYFLENAEGFMKEATGVDGNVHSFGEHLGKTFSSRMKSINASLGAWGLLLKYSGGANGGYDSDAYLQDKDKLFRTIQSSGKDYRKDVIDNRYGSIIQRMISGTTEQIPNMLLDGTLSVLTAGASLFSEKAVGILRKVNYWSDFAYNTAVEGGDLLLDMLEKGFSPDIALATAAVGGMINGWLEAEFDDKLPPFNTFKKWAEANAKAQNKYVAHRFYEAIGEGLKNLLVSEITEPAQEIMEELVSIGAYNAALAFEKQYGALKGRDDLKFTTPEEIADAVKQTWLATITSTPLMTIGGSVGKSFSDRLVGGWGWQAHASDKFYVDSSVNNADNVKIVKSSTIATLDSQVLQGASKTNEKGKVPAVKVVNIGGKMFAINMSEKQKEAMGSKYVMVEESDYSVDQAIGNKKVLEEDRAVAKALYKGLNDAIAEAEYDSNKNVLEDAKYRFSSALNDKSTGEALTEVLGYLDDTLTDKDLLSIIHEEVDKNAYVSETDAKLAEHTADLKASKRGIVNILARAMEKGKLQGFTFYKDGKPITGIASADTVGVVSDGKLMLTTLGDSIEGTIQFAKDTFGELSDISESAEKSEEEEDIIDDEDVSLEPEDFEWNNYDTEDEHIPGNGLIISDEEIGKIDVGTVKESDQEQSEQAPVPVEQEADPNDMPAPQEEENKPADTGSKAEEQKPAEPQEEGAAPAPEEQGKTPEPGPGYKKNSEAARLTEQLMAGIKEQEEGNTELPKEEKPVEDKSTKLNDVLLKESVEATEDEKKIVEAASEQIKKLTGEDPTTKDNPKIKAFAESVIRFCNVDEHTTIDSFISDIVRSLLVSAKGTEFITGMKNAFLMKGDLNKQTDTFIGIYLKSNKDKTSEQKKYISDIDTYANAMWKLVEVKKDIDSVAKQALDAKFGIKSALENAELKKLQEAYTARVKNERDLKNIVADFLKAQKSSDFDKAAMYKSILDKNNERLYKLIGMTEDELKKVYTELEKTRLEKLIETNTRNRDSYKAKIDGGDTTKAAKDGYDKANAKLKEYTDALNKLLGIETKEEEHAEPAEVIEKRAEVEKQIETEAGEVVTKEMSSSEELDAAIETINDYFDAEAFVVPSDVDNALKMLRHAFSRFYSRKSKEFLNVSKETQDKVLNLGETLNKLKDKNEEVSAQFLKRKKNGDNTLPVQSNITTYEKINKDIADIFAKIEDLKDPEFFVDKEEQQQQVQDITGNPVDMNKELESANEKKVISEDKELMAGHRITEAREVFSKPFTKKFITDLFDRLVKLCASKEGFLPKSYIKKILAGYENDFEFIKGGLINEYSLAMILNVIPGDWDNISKGINLDNYEDAKTKLRRYIVFNSYLAEQLIESAKEIAKKGDADGESVYRVELAYRKLADISECYNVVYMLEDSHYSKSDIYDVVYGEKGAIIANGGVSSLGVEGEPKALLMNLRDGFAKVENLDMGPINSEDIKDDYGISNIPYSDGVPSEKYKIENGSTSREVVSGDTNAQMQNLDTKDTTSVIPTADKPFMKKENGMYVFDKQTLAEAIVNASNNKVSEKVAKATAEFLSLIPEAYQNKLITTNIQSGFAKFIMNENDMTIEEITKFSELGYSKTRTLGFSVLDSARIILSERSTDATAIHEAFHLITGLNDGLRAEVYSKIAEGLKNDKKSIKKFVEENFACFEAIYNEADEVMSTLNLLNSDSGLLAFEYESIDEAVTRMFEAWLRNSDKSKSATLSDVFGKIAQIFKNIYKAVTGEEFIPRSIDEAYGSLFNEYERGLGEGTRNSVRFMNIRDLNNTSRNSRKYEFTKERVTQALTAANVNLIQSYVNAFNTKYGAENLNVDNDNVTKMVDVLEDNNAFRNLTGIKDSEMVAAIKSRFAKRVIYSANSYSEKAKELNRAYQAMESGDRTKVDEFFHGDNGIVAKIRKNDKNYTWGGAKSDIHTDTFDNFMKVFVEASRLKFTDKEKQEITRYLRDREYTLDEKTLKKLINGLIGVDNEGNVFVKVVSNKKSGLYDGGLVELMNIVYKDDNDKGINKDGNTWRYADLDYISVAQTMLIENQDVDLDVYAENSFLDTNIYQLLRGAIIDAKGTTLEIFNGSFNERYAKDILKNITAKEEELKISKAEYEEMKRRHGVTYANMANSIAVAISKVNEFETKYEEQKGKVSDIAKENQQLRADLRDLHKQLKDEISKTQDILPSLAKIMNMKDEEINNSSPKEIIAKLNGYIEGFREEANKKLKEKGLYVLDLDRRVSGIKTSKSYKLLNMYIKAVSNLRSAFASKNGHVDIQLENLLNAISLKKKDETGKTISTFTISDIMAGWDEYSSYYSDLINMLDDFGIINVSDDGKSFEVLKRVDQTSVDELCDIIDEVKRISKRSWNKFNQERAAREDRLDKLVARIRKGLKQFAKMSDAQVDKYMEKYSRLYRMGSLDAERARTGRTYHDLQFELMTHWIKRMSPETYALLFGGFIDGEWQKDNLNALVNEKTRHELARIKAFKNAYGEAYGIETIDKKNKFTSSKVDDHMIQNLYRKKVTLGFVGASKHVEDYKSSEGGIVAGVTDSNIFKDFAKRHNLGDLVIFNNGHMSENGIWHEGAYSVDPELDSRYYAIADYYGKRLRELDTLVNTIDSVKMQKEFADGYRKVELSEQLEKMEKRIEFLRNQLSGNTEGYFQTEYSMQQMLGINVLSHQNDGLLRLVDGGQGVTDNISMSEILWVIEQIDFGDRMADGSYDGKYAAEKNISDWIEKDAGSRYDEVAKVYYRLTGKVLDRVNNYFMLRATTDNSFLGAEIDMDSFVQDGLNPEMDSHINPFVNKGITYQRKHVEKTVNLNLIDNYMVSVKNQEQYIYLKEKMDDIRYIFNDKNGLRSAFAAGNKNLDNVDRGDVQETYRKSLQKTNSFFRQLDIYLENIAGKGYSDSDDFYGKLASKARNNLAISRLVGNLVSIGSNESINVFSIAENGLNRTFSAMARQGDLAESFIYDICPQLANRQRMDTYTLSKQEYETPTKLDELMLEKYPQLEGSMFKTKNALKKAIDFSFDLMQKIDTRVANTYFLATYERLMEENKDKDGFRELYAEHLKKKPYSEGGEKYSAYEHAIAEIALQKTLDIVQSQNSKDNANMYSSRDNMIKNMLLFTTQANKIFNYAYGGFMDFIDEEGTIFDNQEKRRLLMEFAEDLAVIGLAVSTTMALKGMFLPDDDDETLGDWLETIGFNFLAESTANIPFIGSSLEQIFDGVSGASTNTASAAARIINAYKKSNYADEDAKKERLAKAWESFFNQSVKDASSYLAPIPYNLYNNVKKTFTTKDDFGVAHFNPGYMLNNRWGNYFGR